MREPHLWLELVFGNLFPMLVSLAQPSLDAYFADSLDGLYFADSMGGLPLSEGRQREMGGRWGGRSKVQGGRRAGNKTQVLYRSSNTEPSL